MDLQSVPSGEKAENQIPGCPPHSPRACLSRAGSGSALPGRSWSKAARSSGGGGYSAGQPQGPRGPPPDDGETVKGGGLGRLRALRVSTNARRLARAGRWGR